MQLQLRVVTDPEPYTVTTNLFTVVAWERKFKAKASQMANAMGLEDLAFLAYEASKQHGVVVPAVFDDFLRKIENVEVVGAEDVTPTDGGHDADS